MRCVVYEARFCLASLKGGGCGLDGTCPVAGIERAPSCLTSGCLKSLEWHSGPNYGPRHLFCFSSISLYYAKLQSNQTIHHFKNPLHFLTYAILFISIFSHGRHSLSIQQDSIVSWDSGKLSPLLWCPTWLNVSFAWTSIALCSSCVWTLH